MRYMILKFAYVYLLVLLSICSNVHAADVQQINQMAESKCNNLSEKSNDVLLCAIWLNSLPVVPMHESISSDALFCGSEKCTAANAQQICESKGYKKAVRFTEVEANAEIGTQGRFTDLWCQ